MATGAAGQLEGGVWATLSPDSTEGVGSQCIYLIRTISILFLCVTFVQPILYIGLDSDRFYATARETNVANSTFVTLYF